MKLIYGKDVLSVRSAKSVRRVVLSEKAGKLIRFIETIEVEVVVSGNEDPDENE